MSQPDHLAAPDILLQLPLHQGHGARRLAGLGAPQQHVAGVTAPLKQRCCNTEHTEIQPQPSVPGLAPRPSTTHRAREGPASSCSSSLGAGRRALTSEGDYLVCAVAELQQDIGVGRMEKVQLLQRSSVSLKPQDTVRTHSHVNPETAPAQAQLLLTPHRTHPGRHLPVSAQLILTDSVRTSAGIFFSLLSFPPQASCK